MRGQAIERDNVQAQIVAKALNDGNFKRSLLSNPRAVIGREMGFELPADLKIHVVEETPNALYVVLPHSAGAAGSELSDAELEAVAGGKGSMGTKTRNGSDQLQDLE